jgi:hypothetical protein
MYAAGMLEARPGGQVGMLEPSDALLAALPAARWLRWWLLLLLLPDAAPPLLPAPVASCTKWASIATTVLMQHHCKVLLLAC